MPRQINPTLRDQLIRGNLLPLLTHIKSDPELRLEVRTGGEAFVYYRKGKALEIGSLKVDRKYGNVPPCELAVTNPSQYFDQIKLSIDSWVKKKRDRAEFDSQQKIAASNQSVDDKYLIIDMEYQFEQHQIDVEARESGAGFDLLGVDRKSGRVVLFELKRGLNAWRNGTSNIEKHISDYETFMQGNNSRLFRENLNTDVRNILEDKIALGLIDNYEIADLPEIIDPEFVVLYHHKEYSERRVVLKDLNDRYKLIFISPKEGYKLK